MKPVAGILDYGRGNLRSVEKALEQAGFSPRIFDAPFDSKTCQALVLPGVGSFGDCSRSLRQRGLTPLLLDWLTADRPFLGICLGYQILFESSEESPEDAGLGFLRGTVRRFSRQAGNKIPHMGWNTIATREGQPLFTGLPDEPHVYFVHSFRPEPTDAEWISSTTEYCGEFAASIGRGNVHAVQFHPEKSQRIGLRILRNFHSLV